MPSFRVELHSHCQGDPVDTYLAHTVFEQIDQAKKVGLDAIAVTWHQLACVNPKAEAYARERNMVFISGMEAEIDGRHLVVLNLSENDLSGEPTWDDIRALRQRKPGVLVMAPHAFYPHHTCIGEDLEGNADCVDAIEWCNMHVNWVPAALNPNLRAERWARREGKALIACSDAHSLDKIGSNASTVEADQLTVDSILDGVRAGRVTFARKSMGIFKLAFQGARYVVLQPRCFGHWLKSRVGLDGR